MPKKKSVFRPVPLKELLHQLLHDPDVPVVLVPKGANLLAEQRLIHWMEQLGLKDIVDVDNCLAAYGRRTISSPPSPEKAGISLQQLADWLKEIWYEREGKPRPDKESRLPGADRAHQQSTPPADSTATPTGTALPLLASAKELAELIGKPLSAVDSFLRRYRDKFSDCYMPTDSPRRNEPKYLYRTADVLADLKEHFATDENQS